MGDGLRRSRAGVISVAEAPPIVIRRPVVLSTRSFSTTFETGYSVNLTRLDDAGTSAATAVTARQDEEIVVAKTERAFRPLPPFVLFCRFDPAATCCAVCAHVPPPEYPMHKKRAQFSLHALPLSPTTGMLGYVKKECALLGASPLTHRPSK